jgi:hypothetical protein
MGWEDYSWSIARGRARYILTCLALVALEVNVIMTDEPLNCRPALEPFG